MKRKYKYLLKLNGGSKRAMPLFFAYRNTKNIELRVSNQTASISLEMTINYFDRNDLNDSYLINLFKDSIKHIALLHITKYQSPVKIKTIILELVDNGDTKPFVDLTKNLKLYSMIEGELINPISKEWRRTEVLQSILFFQQSKDKGEREIAALYAYLYSKTKVFETERFTYLWMAMNGFYSSKASENNKNNDREAMSELVKSMQLGSRVLTKAQRNELGKQVMLKLFEINVPITQESLLNEYLIEFTHFLESEIHSLKSENGNYYDLSSYGFMITDFPYYLRCNLFHTNKPMELFSFVGDMELNAITVTNKLLEEFLDNNLITLFQKSD